jgi:hypothetical protein
MGKRKTAAERAEEAKRYALARAARRDKDFEPFFADPNQTIRAVAAQNPAASAAVLDRFADDRFWSVKVTIADRPNTTRGTLLRLLEPDRHRRGVVHHAARKRLESNGIVFSDDGMPVDTDVD